MIAVKSIGWEIKMEQGNSGISGNEFDDYMAPAASRAAGGARAGGHSQANASADVDVAATRVPIAAAKKRKLQRIAVLGVLGVGVIAAIAFLRPQKEAPVSADMAAIMAAAKSVDAAKAAVPTQSEAPKAPPPTGAVSMAVQPAPAAPAAPVVPATAAQAPAPAVSESTVAPVGAAVPAAHPVATQPAAPMVAAEAPPQAPAPKAAVATETSAADDGELVNKLRRDLAGERSARLRAEKRAQSLGAATVAAVLSDGVVLRDAKGQERVIAVGEKVSP
jgi:hypothetical protein